MQVSSQSDFKYTVNNAVRYTVKNVVRFGKNDELE